MKYKVTVEMYFNDYDYDGGSHSIRADLLMEVRERFKGIYIGHDEDNEPEKVYMRVEEYV